MKNKTLKPITDFNTIAGFPRTQRGIYDNDVLSQMKFIDEELKELKEAMNFGDINNTLKEAADLIVVTAGLIHRLGYDPDEVMDVVNESNMSKFCYSEEDAKESVELLNETQSGRYEDIHYKKVGDYYVIYGIPKGSSGRKILKGKNYREIGPMSFKSDCL